MAAAASRSMWNGAITFGLVTIPVKLYPAVRQERINFHLLHDQDQVRLKQQMVCPAHGSHGQEVHPEHRVKGFEVAPDQYVIVQDSELEAFKPTGSRSITIEAFVPLEEIDPRMYDKPYYLLPAENGAKNYELLKQAMVNKKRVAVARFVMRGKQYFAALRPIGDVLCLYTMRYSDEVIQVNDAEVPDVSTVKVDQRELNMAVQLVDSLEADFDPSEYKNDFIQRVKDLIEAKANGKTVDLPAAPRRTATKAPSLLGALEASLEHVKGKTEGKAKVGVQIHTRAHRAHRRKK